MKCTVNCDAHGLPAHIPVPSGQAILTTGVKSVGSTLKSVLKSQTSGAKLSALAHHGFRAPNFHVAHPIHGHATGPVDINRDGLVYTGREDDMSPIARGRVVHGTTGESHWLGPYHGATLHYPYPGRVHPGYFGNFGYHHTGYPQSGYWANHGGWLPHAGQNFRSFDDPCAALNGRSAVISQKVLTTLYRLCPPGFTNAGHPNRAVFDKAQSSLNAEAKPVAEKEPSSALPGL